MPRVRRMCPDMQDKIDEAGEASPARISVGMRALFLFEALTIPPSYVSIGDEFICGWAGEIAQMTGTDGTA